MAVGGLLVSSLLATQIDLIARGYGTLTWVIIVIYLVPLFTIGIYRAFTTRNQRTSP